MSESWVRRMRSTSDALPLDSNFRDSFCTALLSAGVPSPTVQRLMNHSLVTTTALYAHPGADEARRAVETLAGGAESR
jgi:site-specific recombinase XerD